MINSPWERTLRCRWCWMVVKLQNLVWSAIHPHRVFERHHDLLPVLALIHIDKIDHDDSTQIAQPDLSDDLFDRVRVDLDDRVFQTIRFPDVLAGIYVDRDQRFGLIDDAVM